MIRRQMLLILSLIIPVSLFAQEEAKKVAPLSITHFKLTEEKENENQNRGVCKTNICTSKGCGSCCTVIETVPFTISLPGSYCLANGFTISSTPCTMVTDSIITIKSSCVTLDLNGFEISGGKNGVTITEGLDSVTLKNGTIRNTTAEAILVARGTQCIQLLDLKLINVNQCDGLAGIVFLGDAGSHSTSNVIKNVSITDSGAGGISLRFTDYTKIINSQAYSITSTPASLSAFGFEARNANIVSLENCTAANIISMAGGYTVCGSFSGPSLGAVGYALVNCQGGSLINCQASKIAAPFHGADGFFINCCRATSIEQCSSNYNSSLGPTHGFRSAGSTATVTTQCQACGNTATSTSSFGVARGFVIDKDLFTQTYHSLSQENKSDGFYLDYSTSVSCVLGNNEAVSNGDYGFNNPTPTPLPVTAYGDKLYQNFGARNGITNFLNIPNVSSLGAAAYNVGDNIDGL